MTTTAPKQMEIKKNAAPRGGIGHNGAAIAAIAYRDLLKFLRDRARLFSTFLFPLIFIGFLGGGMQATFGANSEYDFLAFIFTGVLAQTLWQSTAMGIVSLLEDRQNDFSQEIFVSPISRYTIVFGKIFGETLVALPQGLGIILFGILLQVPMDAARFTGLLATGLLAALYGGAFGMALLGFIPSRRAADQLFPFVFLPQYFTAGVFMPINNLPPLLNIVSLLSPLRYAVDLMRGLFYWNTPAYSDIVLFPPWLNFAIMATSFLGFMVIGTIQFVRAERNR
ncbi:hypothetical protein FBQ82_12585 [Anaerolineae bacterium CFX7]|nr:hypothetical protein [Anaerolineae bacterium CFX7]